MKLSVCVWFDLHASHSSRAGSHIVCKAYTRETWSIVFIIREPVKNCSKRYLTSEVNVPVGPLASFVQLTFKSVP